MTAPADTRPGAATAATRAPPDEYRAARERAAFLARTDIGTIRGHGRDPVTMLQGLITNDIAGASPDRAVYAAVLSPKGRMVADLRAHRTGADLLLEVAVGARAGLLEHFRKFVPPRFARFEDATAAWRVFGVYGPAAADVIRRALDTPADTFARAGTTSDSTADIPFADTAVRVVRTACVDIGGWELLVPVTHADAVSAALHAAGAAPISAATFDVLRLESGTPRWGAELDENTIPLEAGLRARAINESKGCYTGQEVIVRILHRGHVNWLLRGVLLGAAAPVPGDGLMAPDGDKRIGRITSTALSPRMGQHIALAYVRRERVPPLDARIEGNPDDVVRIVELPFSPLPDDVRRGIIAGGAAGATHGQDTRREG